MMRPNRSSSPLSLTAARHTRLLMVTGMGMALWLSACSKPLVLDETLPQQLAEISCVEDCRLTKERCDADARYDYSQCQAGYQETFRSYRWCLASSGSRDDCGYPWWSCAENLYGYCSNRYQECERACRSGP